MRTERDLPRGTLTFLFTDVEGSTRLLRELGRERYGEVLERIRRLLREAFEQRAGIEVDSQGDALFVVFRSAGAAVAAAAEAQHVLNAQDWPGQRSVRVRMGCTRGRRRYVPAGMSASRFTARLASVVRLTVPGAGLANDG